MTRQGRSTPSEPSLRRRPLLISLGNRIRELRDSKRWSQRELAARTGVSTSLLAKYEGGWNEPPLQTLLKLAHVLEVPLGALADPSPALSPLLDQVLLDRLHQLRLLPRAEREAAIGMLDLFLGFRNLVEAHLGASGPAR